jgi:phosphodiesterase/alkaline phosphatase D-like protein
VVGDVTADTAVLWARADREGTLKVHLSGGKHHGAARLAFHSADDYAGQVVLDGLKPGTSYRYRPRTSGRRRRSSGPPARRLRLRVLDGAGARGGPGAAPAGAADEMTGEPADLGDFETSELLAPRPS